MPRNRTETKVITEAFDASMWSIAAALGAAVVYLACLT